MEPTNQISEEFWLAENQDEGCFLVIRTITTASGIITSYILERHPDLEEAKRALEVLQEDGPPANACLTGNVIGLGGAKDGVVPFLFDNRRRSMLRRWLKGM